VGRNGADRVTDVSTNPPAPLRERWNGFYALSLYHPLDTLARALRRQSRAWRGKTGRHEQPTHLRRSGWSDIFRRRKIVLTETRKCGGNVSLGELAILAQAAAGTPAGREIIEIGTFDGRTTLNLALNAPAACPVFTLDLPPGQATEFALDEGEDQFVDKPRPGARFAHNPAARRITQLCGDSARYDWSAHAGRAGLVFVDGSHAYDYVQADSRTALRLAAPGGVVLWHDYGVWDGVTRALEDLERSDNLGLRHIRGTSLVVWRGA
jgi:hypothetical protein